MIFGSLFSARSLPFINSSLKAVISKSSFFTRGNIQHRLRQIFVCVGKLTFAVIGENAFALYFDFRLQLLCSSLCNLLILFYRDSTRLCIYLQRGKIGIKKDRKIFICNKEITVNIYDVCSGLGGKGSNKFLYKKIVDLEKYTLPRFNSPLAELFIQFCALKLSFEICS